MGDSIKLSDVVPSFCGDGDISLWLEKLELVAKLKKIEDLAVFVPLFLNGAAFDVYQQLTADEKADFEAVKTCLVSTFGLSSFKAYSQFKERHLAPGEAPDVFLSDLRRLAGAFGYKGAGATAILCCQFVDGLPEPCRGYIKAVHGAEIADVNELLKRAKGYLMEDRGGYSGFSGVRSREARPQASRCNGCFRRGHVQKDCNVECHKCRKRGHIKANCTESGNDSGEVYRAPESSPANSH